MYWSSHNKYIGRWKGDKRKGYGVFIEHNGPKYYGTWTRGKKSGYGITVFTDGTYYEGGYLHDEKKGKGKLCLPNGDVVVGDWSDNKVTGAVYHTRKFTDVPRPLRAIFLANVTEVQKTEDKSLFTSSDKWLEFVKTALDVISPETCEVSKIFTTIAVEGKAGENLQKKFGLRPLAQVLAKFVYLFTWEYNGAKATSKKDWTFLLSTAVDDINSFIACLANNLTEKLSLDYKQHKQLHEVLIATVFPKIYNSLFPLYKQVNKSAEALLRAKIVELKDVTPALIGVKPKFHLHPMPPQEEEQEDEVATADTSKRASVRRPFPPKPSARVSVAINSADVEFSASSSASPDPGGANQFRRPPTAAGRGGLRGRGRWTGSSRHSVQLPSKAISHQLSPETATQGSNNRRRSQSPVDRDRLSRSIAESGENGSAGSTESASTTASKTRKKRQTQDKKKPYPYQRVINALCDLATSTTPVAKLACLTTAAQGILACVDEYNEDKSKQIVMGAEDKFPVLIYALIRANVDDLWSHCNFIQDFVTEHLGDEESKYRASEFVDALKYVGSLDWELRDLNNVLVPLKMIVSSVAWSAKAVERLKFPENVNAEATRMDILLALSSIFRIISSRQTDLYEPLEIAEEFVDFLSQYESFFTTVFGSKEVGLKLRKVANTSATNGRSHLYYLDFEIRHPLYVYSYLAEACIAPEAE